MQSHGWQQWSLLHPSTRRWERGMIPSCTYISQEGLYARIMHKACKPVLAYRYGCSCIHRGYNLSLPHLRLREIAAVSDVRIMLVDGAQEQQVRGVVSSQETRWRSHHASRVAGLQPTICDDVKICTAPPTQKSRAFSGVVWFNYSTSLHHSCCHLLQ